MKHINSGSYGDVYDAGANSVVKKLPLFVSRTVLETNNLTEAVFAATGRKRKFTESVIGYQHVTIDADNMSIYIEKGVKTMQEFIISTPYLERVAKIETYFKGMISGLYQLHEQGLTHLDFKPGNIVITATHQLKIIDFGSSIMYKRSANFFSEVYCTYTFCAPEAIPDDAIPTVACDAYSLGATLHFYIYKNTLVHGGSRNDIIKEFENGNVTLPDTCPAFVPQQVFDDMVALLNPDPAKRATVASLYYK
eukprot:gene19675-26360_t